MRVLRQIAVFVAAGLLVFGCKKEDEVTPVEPEDPPYDLMPADSSRIDKETLEPGDVSILLWNVGHFSMGYEYLSTLTRDDIDEKSQEFKRVIEKFDTDYLCLVEWSNDFLSAEEDTVIKAEAYVPEKYKYRYHGNQGEQREYVYNVVFSQASDVTGQNTRMGEYKCNEPDYMGYYYMVSQCRANDVDFLLVTTHFGWSYDYDVQPRRQIAELERVFREQERVIIVGDFNTKFGYSYGRFAWHGYDIANTNLTWPTWDPTYVLDNVVVKGFEVVDCTVVPNELSDHYAVACTLRLKQEEQE